MANTAAKTNTVKKEKKEEMVTVVVPKPHNVTGDTETVVSVNGEMYQIMYGRPVKVPKNVAEVILNSQELQQKIAVETDAALLIPNKPSIADL